MKFWNEFKAFAMRGNVLDLAIAVVIGAAFGKIVSSLVDGIVMPLLSLLLRGVNITSKTFVVGTVVIKWGMFLQSVIDFAIIAFSIFVFIKFLNAFLKQQGLLTPTRAVEERLLIEIRDLLRENLKNNLKEDKKA